tara:strand:- start:216 stop:2237 length:2022 start_codon:yes stop_codon:yes gene_type:complete
MDIDDMINTIMNMPDKDNTATMRSAYFSGKNHPFEDFEGTAANPFEEEAIEMAIRSGKIDKETGRIIHAGRTSSNDMNSQIQNRRYDVAREQALGIGKKLMNEAADQQNIRNRRIFTNYQDVPRPFDTNGKLNATYLRGVAGTLKDSEEGGQMQGKAFNPWKFDSQGNRYLVTKIMSTSQTTQDGSGRFQEGWARWYHNAAKDLGYAETKYNNQGKELPRAIDHKIPAHYVHKNTFNINDSKMAELVTNHIKGLQKQNPNISHEEIKASLLKQNFAFANTHHGFHDYKSLHDRHNRKNQDNQMKREGRESPFDDDIEDMNIGATVNQGQADNSIFHPESEIEKLIGQGGAAFPKNSSKPSKKLITAMKKHYDMDDDDVMRILHGVFAGRQGHGGEKRYHGKSPTQRLANALYEHEMDRYNGNLPSDHHYTGPIIPLDGKSITPQPTPTSPYKPDVTPSVTDTGIPTNLPRVSGEGVNLDRVISGSPPSRIESTTNDLPNVNRPPITRDPNVTRLVSEGINGIKTNIPSNVRSNVMGGGGANPRSPLPPNFASMLTGRGNVNMNPNQVNAPYQSLTQSPTININGRNVTLKSQMEDYIETVQMELAKSVIDDLHNVKKMDMESTYDIAILASHVQRPSNDIISIYHTRGDWRNIAKSFGIEHRQVQLIKVALHG